MKTRLFIFTLTLTLTACSTAPVNAWDRGDLSRASMQWQTDVMESALNDHIHTAKEAASGGVGTGGGGCGCY